MIEPIKISFKVFGIPVRINITEAHIKHILAELVGRYGKGATKDLLLGLLEG